MSTDSESALTPQGHHQAGEDADEVLSSAWQRCELQRWTTGKSSESWKAVKTLAVCFDSDTEISHLIMTALYLTNHRPSDKKGERYTR